MSGNGRRYFCPRSFGQNSIIWPHELGEMEEDVGRREIEAPAFSVIDGQVEAGRYGVSVSPKVGSGSPE